MGSAPAETGSPTTWAPGSWRHAYQEPFEDEHFPASNLSISLRLTSEHLEGHEGTPPWVRALDLNRDDPDYLWQSISPSDIVQGAVGDCWLIAALSSVAQQPERIKRCFRNYPSGGVSDTGKYVVQLYDVTRPGWIDVIVDDRLPCKHNRSENEKFAKPLFSNANTGEIWPQILEKAIAKYHGSYGALAGGRMPFAWVLTTGCTPRTFTRVAASVGKGKEMYKWYDHDVLLPPPGSQPTSLFTPNTKDGTMRKSAMANHRGDSRLLSFIYHQTILELLPVLTAQYADKGDFVAAAIMPKLENDTVYERATEKGLIPYHSYSILRMVEIPHSLRGKEEEPLVLLLVRNPWGNSADKSVPDVDNKGSIDSIENENTTTRNVTWNGDWSDASQSWATHPAVERHLEQLLGYPRSEHKLKGLFWMSWEDFELHFTEVDACDVDLEHPFLNAPRDTGDPTMNWIIMGIFVWLPAIMLLKCCCCPSEVPTPQGVHQD